MSASFVLNYDKLSDPMFGAFVEGLRGEPCIDSSETFNRFCRQACLLWNQQFGAAPASTSVRSELLERIDRRSEGAIPTTWGGVVVVRYEHPQVEKYLVVPRGGYLSLETHEQKDERLEVREGAGLILSRRKADQPLVLEALAPGNRFHFEPGMEHCLIGTDNLLVFEKSIDPKGMDRDLVFIYTPDITAAG